MDRAWKSIILEWLGAVCLFPIASLYLIFLAILSVIPTISKALLLFSIVAVNTPFAVMFNISILARSKLSVMEVKRAFLNPKGYVYNLVDPRIYVGIEVKAIVYDFFKMIEGGFLLVLSTGVITFYTASLLAFYISMAVGVMSILLSWLNTSSLSKTAFSCLCAGYGLNPLMFLFSFIGLFDIGCHPIAKCSFTADKAFLFTDSRPRINYTHGVDVDRLMDTPINFPWDAFERGLFQFRARIDFINREDRQYILKTSMVLYLWEREICHYPVERLELHEGYQKKIELLCFLLTLEDGFVTDKMRGRYEHSLTLQEIVDGVEEYDGYRIVTPLQSVFVVAGRTD